jgi:small subunit ribosomal protein S7
MRRKRTHTRVHRPDPKYSNVLVSRFVNYLMHGGKKNAAQHVLYGALDSIATTSKLDPIQVFEKALENVTPMVEVASRRVGGANYQVPREVRVSRKFMLAARWLIDAASSKKGKPMAQKLAEELLLAYKNEGNTIKKKLDTHRMAEANRAFAHFSW